jgi:Soluble NSF attachment protein, SNAP
MGVSQEEKAYRWFRAAKLYEQELESGSASSIVAAESWQKIGFCYDLASRQAASTEDFKTLRQLAVEAYEKAAGFFSKDRTIEPGGKREMCLAIAEYLRSWLMSGSSERANTLDKCRNLAKRAMQVFKTRRNDLFYGQTANLFTTCVYERSQVESDGKEKSEISREGMNNADDAIQVLSKLDSKEDLLLALSLASIQAWYVSNLSEKEEDRKSLASKSVSYSESAIALSKEIDDPYSKAMSRYAAVYSNLDFTNNSDVALKYAKEMLEQASTVQDNYLRGVAFNLLANVIDAKISGEADPDKRKEHYEEIVRYAEEGIRYFNLVFQDSFVADTCHLLAQTYSALASDPAVGLSEKCTYSDKAVEIGKKGLEHAIRSGSPEGMITALHGLSKAYHYQSNLEPRKDKKRELLRKALDCRNEYVQTFKTSFPSNSWVIGVGEVYAAQLEIDLSRLESDQQDKIALFTKGTSHMEEGVFSCKSWITSPASPLFVARLAEYEYALGGVLDEGYLLTAENTYLKRAIEVYTQAAENFKKADLPSRVADSYWNIAQNQDSLGKHDVAGDSFRNALAEYKKAATRIPHFADFYLDYGNYMMAWSEVEDAKLAHEHEEYTDAMKHYDKAANFLKSSKLWNYLSPNFLAWSVLEQAESLSRKENSTESIEAFNKAAELFKEAEEAFEKEIGKVQNLDEKQKAIELDNASARRRDYCLARVNVEEARIYDRKGEYFESAEKYDIAACKFEKMMAESETEADRNEVKPIAYMCRAWQKTKTADGTDSPELYDEASEMFLKVKEFSTRNKSIQLASGNSAFCKALKFGTKFEATGDKNDFSQAKQFLASAANYYSKAGFEHASLWTSATEILFDAYNYMLTAEVDTDPEKRMKTYLLAEKCLERSGGFYEAAGYIGKRDLVFKTLEKVKEKRKFVLSLGELLAVPVDASSTSFISAPGMTVEQPVGLQRFRGAFMQANLIVPKREVVAGEKLPLEIHVANLGRAPAFLMEVKGIVPEEFDLIEKPDKCAVSDGSFTMKGRKLGALETDEMKLVLKAKKKGVSVFTPRIEYMDESGTNKSFELEKVTIDVKELGIRGWLKGAG